VCERSAHGNSVTFCYFIKLCNYLISEKKTYILVKAVRLAISGEIDPERPIPDKFLLQINTMMPLQSGDGDEP
jgi:hypothetical protein